MSVTEGPEEGRDGLGDAGSALWDWLTSKYAFDERELPVLELACKQADLVAALEEAVEEEGVVVDGSRGQPRLNPCVGELRQSRLAMARLIGELRLPGAEDDRPMTDRQRRAKHAAESRWSQVRAMRGGDGSASAG